MPVIVDKLREGQDVDFHGKILQVDRAVIRYTGEAGLDDQLQGIAETLEFLKSDKSHYSKDVIYSDLEADRLIRTKEAIKKFTELVNFLADTKSVMAIATIQNSVLSGIVQAFMRTALHFRDVFIVNSLLKSDDAIEKVRSTGGPRTPKPDRPSGLIK
jgi:hypothetical protein